MTRTSPILLLGLALALGACSLAGDITPPPALATAQARGLGTLPTATPLAVPDRPPDSQAGAGIFAERCSPCHGETGGGDGLQSADLPNPPTPLRQLDVAQRAIPSEWYTVVTKGRFDRFMPGFASLNDSQRWDVVGYALGLGLPAGMVESGRELYRAACADCHGADGRGGADVPDLITTAFQADRSWLALYGATTNGIGDAMPAFADSLTDDERWTVTAFLRSLWLNREPSSSATPSPTPSLQAGVTPTGSEPAPAGTETTPTAVPAVQGEVSGQIRSGTGGGTVPPGIEVTLHGLDGNAEVVSLAADADPDGRFSFEGLEVVPGRLFAATAAYQGVTYASQIGSFDTDNRLDLPLTIFETTAATGSVQVGRLHLLFEFPADGVLQVVELWLLSNLSDQTVVDPEAGAIQVDLPQGATGLSLDGGALGDRFVQTETGFRDRRELVPGENTGELVFSYNLPYSRRLDFTRTVRYPVGAVVVLSPAGGPAVSGDGLVDGGVRSVGGASLQSYSLGEVEAGGAVRLSLRGQGGVEAGAASNALPIVVGAVALAAALAGVWWIGFRPRRRLTASPAAADDDALLWAIASLDNDFDDGRLDAAAYRERRRDLVRQLRESGRD